MVSYVRDYTALLSGNYWGQPFGSSAQGKGAFVTYSFTAVRPTNVHSAIQFEDPNYFRPMNEVERQAFREAIKVWENISGLTFFEVPAGLGDIDVGVYKLSEFAGYGSYPTNGLVLSNGKISAYTSMYDLHKGIYLDEGSAAGMHLLLHEIGHALGLQHPHDEEVRLVPEQDNGNSTVMSYEDFFPRLGTMDYQAIQAIYGTADKSGKQVSSWSWDANTYTLTQRGSAADEVLRGTNSHDIIYAEGGRDAIDTRGGDDIIYVKGKAWEISAGKGFDVVYVDFAFSDVRRTHVSTDNFYMIPNGGSDWDMHVYAAERIVFTDGVKAFDFAGNAGQMFRLYQAAFDRTPDASGLGYWIRKLDAGIKMVEIADSFLGSPEYQRTYGAAESVSNAKFLELLYTHTLGRGYDQSGYDYWLKKLDGNDTSRRDLLAYFAESDENVARVQPQIADGIWYV